MSDQCGDEKKHFTAIQELEHPSLEDVVLVEIPRVDLKTLPEGSLATFRGNHPASNYLIQVLGSPELGDQREVNLWYLATTRLTLFGNPASLYCPGKGCFRSKAEAFRPEGVLAVGQIYSLPNFKWGDDGELVVSNPVDTRVETYTRVAVQK